jgi:hypothetical protein
MAQTVPSATTDPGRGVWLFTVPVPSTDTLRFTCTSCCTASRNALPYRSGTLTMFSLTLVSVLL